VNALALIEALEAEGMPAEAIIRVLKGAGKRRDGTNAERQARHRERKRNGVTVTRDPAPNERDILTPTRETKTEPKGSSKSRIEEEKRDAIGSCLKAAFVLPADIPSDPWLGFEDMRKRIRKPLTDIARSLAITELRRLRDEEGWPPGDVLNHCTMNSYQGIYPPPRKRNAAGIGKSAAAYAMLNPSPDDAF
jgi:hypothetical protein